MAGPKYSSARLRGKATEQAVLSRRQANVLRWSSAKPASGVRRLTVEEYEAALRREAEAAPTKDF